MNSDARLTYFTKSALRGMMLERAIASAVIAPTIARDDRRLPLTGRL
jgi:hypothetical protein